MDVQCDRCKTEYEFDDALVSGRGTTVKCTNCGFQFKVHKQGPGSTDDRWIVRTTDGHEHVFVALKDLQKAIIARQVGRQDTLSRGGAPPRALGGIAELSPFFEEQKKRVVSIPPPLPRRAASMPPEPMRPPQTTQIGLAGPSANKPAMPSRPPPIPSVSPPPRRERQDTLRPPLESPGVPPPASVTAPLAQTAAAPHPPAANAKVLTMAGPDRDSNAPEVSSPLPPPARGAARRALASHDDAIEPMRGGLRAEMDSIVPSERPARRVGGWVVALVLIASAGILGVMVVRKDIKPETKPEPVAASLDPRAQEFLRSGERALDDGDLELAKENFDKASVVAEKDPRVRLDMARLATVRADVPWLKQRLLSQDSGDETKRSLAELSAKAKAAADVALAASPEDTAAIRVKMDALRIAGERDQARALVTQIISNAQQPETAYVLAALDLAEPDPLWKTIIERLRVAAQAEGNSGRARAALVYALARSGDTAGAKTELDRLGQLSRPHPLLVPLKTFLEKSPQSKLDGGVASAAAAVVDVSALPRPSPAATWNGGGAAGGAGAGGGGGGGGNGIAGDSKSLVSQANAALGRRDYARAEQMFSTALDKNPRDSEAQAGLGDVARAQHNLGGARAAYQKAVAINSHYLPALVGLADVEWEMGDRATAVKGYKEMLDNFPEGALPPQVKQRADAPPPPALTGNPTTNPSASPTVTSSALVPTPPPDPTP